MNGPIELNKDMDPVAAVRRLRARIDGLGPDPTPGALLALRLCDPAMGDGRRLIAGGRFLAMALAHAWRVHGRPVPPIDLRGDPAAAARRLVATHCLYGLAPDRATVTAVRGRLEQWAVDPGTADISVDHAIRRGDRALGFSLDRIAAFDPRPEAPRHPFVAPRLDAIHREHLALRSTVRRCAPWDARAAREALRRADAHLDAIRVVGDVLAGWTHGARADRPAERRRRLELVLRWLRDDSADAERRLRRLQGAVRRRWATFHWQSEFSELALEPWARTRREAA